MGAELARALTKPQGMGTLCNGGGPNEMLQRALVVLLAASTLLAARPAEAYVVVPNHRHLLERAAHTAMRCPDMTPGRYVVEVTVTGREVAAHVTTAPRILYETEQCIVRAFERQPFAEVRGTERFESAFVLMDGGP